MKKTLLYLFFFIAISGIAQTNQDTETNRILKLQTQLEALAIENEGLSQNLKSDINVGKTSLSNFLLAIANVHKLNLNVAPDLNNQTIVNNFTNVSVADLLVFLAKEYNLDLEFTGNIISIKTYFPPAQIIAEKEISASFDALNSLISLDLKNDPLEKVFRKIIDVSGQNLLYNTGMENTPLTLYLKNASLDLAMEKLAETNNLTYSKSRDGFYLFDKPIKNSENNSQNRRNLNNNFNYAVIDTLNRVLDVDFQNTPIVDIIHQLSFDLDLDIYMATPLTEAGNITFKAKHIYYDELLRKIFESASVTDSPNLTNVSNQNRANVNDRNNRNSNIASISSTSPKVFTFKKENNIYFFGTENQLSVRKLEVVQMMHRSVELLGDPTQAATTNRSSGRTVNSNLNFLGGGGIQNNGGFGNINGGINQNIGNTRRIDTQASQFGNNYDSSAEAIVSILPDEVTQGLDIRVDFELNSFLISGPAAKINRFKKFIKEIDKPVPVILIEVMILEVRKSATVDTGVSWGIGDSEVTTQGGIFPEADLTLGSRTVNKIIGGFDGFGSFNIGQVVPNFFATIRAMEQNGNLKVRSTPKLSTLNGHRANLSIGETTYYVVTSQNFFGSQITTSSEVRNFQPIDAQLAISIKPLVSGNGQVTLDINVIQSDFSGDRIEDEAPPNLTSREFSSIIRMQNQDLAILGGLEEKVKSESGSGVPFLARIPIIKWLFSRRSREDSKQKLTILIKPTVIY